MLHAQSHISQHSSMSERGNQETMTMPFTDACWVRRELFFFRDMTDGRLLLFRATFMYAGSTNQTWWVKKRFKRRGDE